MHAHPRDLLIAFGLTLLFAVHGCGGAEPEPDTTTPPADTQSVTDTQSAGDTQSPPVDTSLSVDTTGVADTELATDTSIPQDTSLPPVNDTQEAEDIPVEDTAPQDTAPSGYIGGWPINPNKDTIPDPGFEKCTDGVCIGVGSCNPADANDENSDWKAPTGCSLKEGLPLPRWQAFDQYGDWVDIYDFIGDGKPIVLDVGTPHCKPCKSLAAFFATGDTGATTTHAKEPLNSFGWWKPEYEVVLDMINNEQIRWITVVWSSCSGNDGSSVDKNTVKAWHEEWPHPHIPVLADSDCKFKDYLNVSAMPHIVVLDENLVFTTYATNGPYAGFQALLKMDL